MRRRRREREREKQKCSRICENGRQKRVGFAIFLQNCTTLVRHSKMRLFFLLEKTVSSSDSLLASLFIQSRRVHIWLLLLLGPQVGPAKHQLLRRNCGCATRSLNVCINHVSSADVEIIAQIFPPIFFFSPSCERGNSPQIDLGSFVTRDEEMQFRPG